MNEKTLLFILPGWGGTKANWRPFVVAMESTVPTRVIELPGFGDEPLPDTQWGVEEYAQFVEAKLRQVPPDTRIILLGHSFGGQIATYLAAHHQTICSKLILSGAAVFRPRQNLKKMFFGVIAKAGKLIFRLPVLCRYQNRARRGLYRLADSPDYLATQGLQRDIFKKVVAQDVSDLLPAITVPTLVVWGKADRYTPLHDGQRIASLIPRARLQVFEHGTHGLHIQQTTQLAKAVADFISN